MSEIHASVLYEFQGQDSSELCVTAGETLIIVKENVEEGWLSAKNARGQIGLVPTAYVQKMVNLTPNRDHSDSVYSMDEPGYSPEVGRTPPSTRSVDDDWDEYSEEDSDSEDAPISAGSFSPQAFTQQVSGTDEFANPRDSVSYSENVKIGIVRKGFGRNFAKSGGEDFLLSNDGNPPVTYEASLINSPDGAIWKPSGSQFQCEISSSKKESKLKGIKSFIAYHVTPSFSNIRVSRRYKHFDWLQKQLQEKFICICIPPLPEKQVTGRYEEDFIELRRRQLQQWLNRLALHPVVSKCVVLHSFLTCTEDGRKWKAHKREAEKDPMKGPRFFNAVETHAPAPNWPQVIEHCVKLDTFSGEFDKSNKNMLDILSQFNRRQAGPFQKEYSKMGEVFTGVSLSLALDPDESDKSLLAAMCHTGQTYQSIGQLHAQQSRKDGDRLADELFVLSGLTSTISSLVQLQRASAVTATEARRCFETGRLNLEDRDNVLCRAGIVAQTTGAEARFLAQQRGDDLRRMITDYLKSQVDFFRTITKKLEVSLDQYHKTKPELLTQHL